MADVIQLPGVAEQLKLVAGLRWNLLKNSLQSKNNRWDLIGMILAAAGSAVMVIGLCVAFYAGTYFFLTRGRANWMQLLYWAIFLWWQVVPILVAGFGANFEFRNFLRFPLSLRAFYILGFGYGFADFAAVSSLCWIAAMLVATAVGRVELLPVMALASLLFILVNVTLERLIGSWLEKLLSRRRTREIFLGLFVLSMISLNFVNPLLQRYGTEARPFVMRLLPYLVVFPPALAGRSIEAISQLHPAGFLLASGGLLLYLFFFSALLWRRFAAQYRGEELSETAAPIRTIVGHIAKTEQGADGLGLLSPQVAAVVRKEFRYLTRNGFAYLTLLMPPLLVLVFSSQFAGRHPTVSGKAVSAEMFFPGMMAYLILILMAPAYNCFAYEGRGIQTYFTAPLSFRDVFLGKNLVLVSILTLEIALSMVMLTWRVGLPSIPRLVATIAAIVFTVVGQLTVANWSSLSFPRKLEFGQMRGQRQSGMAVLVAFGSQILTGAISAVILLMGRWLGNPWLPAEAFAFLAAAAVGGYVASLDVLTQLAEKKKEVLIEALGR